MMSTQKKLEAAGIALLLAVLTHYALAATPEGSTIQQLQTQPGMESLWDFLAALPTSVEGQIFWGLLLSGTVGMVSHYLMRWARGEITGGLMDYLFLTYFRRTLLAVSVLVGMALTAISSGVFVTESGQFVGWLNVLWFGLTNGYASDSIANKGATKPETQGA